MSYGRQAKSVNGETTPRSKIGTTMANGEEMMATGNPIKCPFYT